MTSLIVKLFCRTVRICYFLLLIWEKYFSFVVDPTLFIEALTVNRARKKIANGLAKLNYNLKFLDLTVKKVALNIVIHRMRRFPTYGSINALITVIVVAAIISLNSVSPGYVSIVYAVQGSGLTSYPSPMNAISPYSVEQGNQLYQTPLLTLGANLEESSGQDPSETASVSSVSTTAPSSSPSPPTSTSTTSSTPPSPGTNQATTTTSSTETPTTTSQIPGPAEDTPAAPSLPSTTSPSPTTTQQQLSSIYQQPTVPQTSSAIQQLPAQPLIQATPQTQALLQNNPAQPYGIPSTSATIQPQLSALPPTATTFPPSVFPPVNSLQPYGTLGTTGNLGYPSTIGGQYGLGGAGAAGAAAAATSVGTSSQLISPWFPSLPASYCGGTFLLTIEGTPRSNGDDKKIEASDKNDNNHDNNGDDNDRDGNDNKHSKDSDRDKRLLSLQLNSDNTRIFSDDNAISGEIFLGKNNIDKNKGNDFDIKSVFNDCQVVTYSKS